MQKRKGTHIAAIIFALLFTAFLGGFFTLALASHWPYATAEIKFPQTTEAETEEKEYPVPGNGSAWVIETGEKLSQSVVGVSNLTPLTVNGEGNALEMGIGSGVIIDSRGYIVTNYHVISGGKTLMVTLHDGEQVEATVVGTDERTDLALIKIAGSDYAAAVFGNSDLLQVGEQAIAIGNPGGLDFASSVTLGIISGLNRPLTTAEGLRFKLIQTDAAINPGNSGGALVNDRGEVIGINTIKISEEGFEGMGFAIPGNLVKDIVTELMDQGKVVRAGIGVYLLGSIGTEYTVPQGTDLDHGVVISLREGGPGAAAGLKENDVIIAVDAEEVADIYDLQEIIFSHAVGDKINLTVYRDGKEITLAVTLGELEE